MESARDLARDASAATLGFIVGDVPGAIGAMSAARRLDRIVREREPYNLRRRPVAAVSAAPPPRRARQRPTPRRRRRRSRYGVRGRRSMSTRQRRAVKGIVKRVIECDFNSSIYEKTCFYALRCDTTGLVMQRAEQRVEGAAFTGAATGLNSNYLFNAFTPKRLLDAASILYNGKTIAEDYTPVAGNFPVKALTVNYQYCSKKFTFTNHSHQAYEIEWNECVPKAPNDGEILDKWVDALKTENWKPTTPTPQDYGQRPQMLAAWKTLYTTKNTTFTLKPGETRTFFYKFTGCVDFSKVMKNETEIWSYSNKFGMQFSAIIRAKLNYGWERAINESNVPYIGPLTIPNQANSGIACQIDEVFKIQQPDETKEAYEGNFRAWLTKGGYFPGIGDTVHTYNAHTNRLNEYTNQSFTSL